MKNGLRNKCNSSVSKRTNIKGCISCLNNCKFFKKEENIIGDGNAAQKIVTIICKVLEKGISPEKSFYDVDFSV